MPRTIGELRSILRAEGGDIRLLGGGTLEIPRWMRHGAPDAVVHLPSILELRTVQPGRCGATTTLAQIADDPRLPASLRQAAASTGGPALREIATIGGNLAAGYPGCLAVALLTLEDVKLGTFSAQKTRIATESLDDKYIIVDGVILFVEWLDRPDQYTGFRKVAIRAAGGPNVAAVAVRLTESECAIAVGSTGAPPHRLLCTEAAWRRGERGERLADAATEEVQATGDSTATERHRRAVVGVLVRRLMEAMSKEMIRGLTRVR